MLGLWKGAPMVTAELTGADIPRTLSVLNRKGIRLFAVEETGPLTVRFSCSRTGWNSIKGICEKQGDSLRLIRQDGIHRLAKTLRDRALVVAAAVGLFALTLYLPTRSFFFRVEGNERIPARQILAAAEDCGIRFGVARREIRSERMKNALLEAMPELKWAGINTTGCTAVISVRERQPEETRQPGTGVSSIVALRDGYVTSCTVTRGNGLCAPGQVVRKGQVLISGYTDCGICIQATRAEGEVFAETNREFRAVTPARRMVCREPAQQRVGISLLLGKKRINFWKDSGISDATCGRMYQEHYITLPGGFQLPVGLGVETVTDRILVPEAVPAAEAEAALQQFARQGLLKQMTAGQILLESHCLSEEGGLFVLQSRFLCSEMIGRVITEEIGELHGKTD